MLVNESFELKIADFGLAIYEKDANKKIISGTRMYTAPSVFAVVYGHYFDKSMCSFLFFSIVTSIVLLNFLLVLFIYLFRTLHARFRFLVFDACFIYYFVR